MGDGQSGEMMRLTLGLMSVNETMMKGRLRWFGHVQRRQDDMWVKRCIGMRVEGGRCKGRPRKTWLEVVRGDLKEYRMVEENAVDRGYWKYMLECIGFRRT